MTTTLKLWLSTIKTTLTSVGTLVVFALLYALLLVSAYFFIATREATVWQVVVTYVLLILLPAEFFIFQASIIGHALDGKFHWRTIVVNAFKCFVVTIPVVLLAWARIENGVTEKAAPLIAHNPILNGAQADLLTSLVFPRWLFLRAEVLARQGRNDGAVGRHSVS